MSIDSFDLGPTDRFAGQCLIVSSIAGLLVMALHPTGTQMFAHFELVSRLNIAVHSLALLATPFAFIGAMAISRRLAASPNLAVSAIVMYAFASVAVVLAALMSGLIAPRLAVRILDPSLPPDRATMLRMLLRFGGDINQASARVFVVGSAIAILLWSWAMLRTHSFARPLAIYGCIFAVLSAVATASGSLPMDVHGFGAAMLGQAVWFIIAGKELLKPQQA